MYDRIGSPARGTTPASILRDAPTESLGLALAQASRLLVVPLEALGEEQLAALAPPALPTGTLDIAAVGQHVPGTALVFQLDVEDAVGVSQQISKLSEAVEEKL